MSLENFEISDQSVLKPIQNNVDVILEDGEQLCPQCNGNRTVIAYNRFQGKQVKVMCGACLGKGKMDWLEIVTGVKNDRSLDICGSSSASSTSSSESSETVTSINPIKRGLKKFFHG